MVDTCIWKIGRESYTSRWLSTSDSTRYSSHQFLIQDILGDSPADDAGKRKATYSPMAARSAITR